MKNILVTGSNGQLGNEIRVLSNDYKDLNFIFTDVAELDICSYSAIEQFTKDMEIDFIINCAAYTAVDKAESDIALCNDINSNAVGNLGKLANKKGASVIHVSTDYVYSGSSFKPYNENDETSPVSVYGKTKLDGENQLFDNCHSSVVLRTSWLYSEFGNNFVKTMYRLGSERESLGDRKSVV